MPSILNKGAKPAVKPAPVATAAKQAAAPAAAAKPGLSFLKRGQQAMQTMQQEEKKAEMKRKANVYRFYLKEGDKGDITFLDGNLKDGILDIPFLHMHTLQLAGKWTDFICTQDEEPCPICEGGNSNSYVGVLTVIDHSQYTSQRDGKVHKDTKKLFIAKRDTIKLLQEMAAKRGGLRGCRFDVSRIGAKSPNVGSAFDFTQKYSEAELKQFNKSYKDKDNKTVIVDNSVPVNYEEYFAATYLPASELRLMGFGSMAGGAPVGSEEPVGEQEQAQYDGM